MTLKKQIAIGAGAFALTIAVVGGISLADAFMKKNAQAQKAMCVALASRRSMLFDIAQMSDGSTQAQAQAAYERKIEEMTRANCDAALL